MVTYRGSCHCGRIAFEAGAEAEIRRVVACNCSICTRKGYLHWIIPRARFRLLTDPSAMSTYCFNTEVAQHHFCPVCGVAPFYVPRSDPDRIDVNVRCLEGVDPDGLEVERFDGQNWERAERTWERRRR
jgi:hypothetical protein